MPQIVRRAIVAAVIVMTGALALNAAPVLAAPTFTIGTVTPNTSFSPTPGFIMASAGNTFTVPITITQNGGGDTSTRRMTITTTRTGSGGGNALQLRSTGSSGTGGGVTWTVESVTNGGTTSTIVFRYSQAVLIPNGSALSFTVSVSSVPATSGDQVDSFAAAFAEGSGGSQTNNASNTFKRYALEITGVTPPAASAVAGTTLSPVVTIVNRGTSSQTLTSANTTLGGTALSSTGTKGTMPAIAAGATGTVTYANAQIATAAATRTVTAAAANGTTATAPSFSKNVVIGADALDHFTVTAPASATAGTPFNVTATAKDVYGNTLTSYAGTLHITSTDPAATVPSDYTFVGGDLGSHTFVNGVTLATAGSRGVNVNGSGKTGSATVTVNASSLAWIDVTPNPATITAGQTQTFVTQGYDAYNNALGDMTSSTVFAITSGGSCLAASCGSPVAGDYTVTGTVGLLSDTATLHVLPAALDHFTVVAPAVATAGTPFDLTVTANDVYGNTVTGYTGVLHVESADSQAVLPGDYTFTGGNAGTHTFVAGATLKTAGTSSIEVSGSGRLGSTSVTVLAAGLDSIAVSPDPATIAAGSTRSYTSAGFDAYGNGLGDVTASTVFTISGAGSCTGTACGATVAGDYTVTGTDGSATDTATLHVTAAALDHIAISPSSATVIAGATQAFSVEGFDQFGNSRGSATSQTTFTITGSGACVANACSATTVGDHTVTATDGAATDTAVLHVNVGPLHHLVLTPGTATIEADTSQVFTAEGFDQYDNTRGDVTSATTFTITPSGVCTGASCAVHEIGDYTVTGTNGAATGTATIHATLETVDHIVISPPTPTITAGTLQPFTAEAFDAVDAMGDVTAETTFTITAPGACVADACGATAAGDYTVTATYGLYTDTATLHVTAAALDHLVLSPDVVTIEADTSQTYTAEGFDEFDNSRGDVTGATTFTITAPGTCTGASCAVHAIGDYTVTGTDGSATGTATIHATLETVSQIVISPATETITAGTQQAFTVEAFDVADSMGDFTGETTFTISAPGTCVANACGATVAGDYTVTASYGLFTDTATLHVDAAGLDHLALTPASATITAGTTQTLAAEGRDAFDNTLGDVTGATTFTISGAGSCTVAQCGATASGDYTVTGTDGTATGTAVLHVTAATLHHLVLSPASATITAGTTETLAAEGFDVYNNTLGDVTGATTFTITAPGTCTVAQCGATATGDYTITGTDGSATGTAVLHVTAATLHHLVLTPASATITAGTTETLAAEGFDVYDNSRGDVTGATTFTISGSGSCTVAQCGATASGDYTITGTDGSATGTAILHVTAAALDHLVLSPASATIAAGTTETLAAEGRDVYDNSRGDVTGATTFTISGSGSCTGAQCGATATGDYTITGTDGSATGTATLHVTAAALHHFALGAPGTATAGTPFDLVVTAKDVHGNTVDTYVGDISLTTSDPAATIPANYTFTTGEHGVHTFTGGVTFTTAGAQDILVSGDGATGTTILTVTPAALDHLVLAPASSIVTAGTSATLHAEGHDAYDNIIGDVTPDTTFTVTGAASCVDNACGATLAGTYTITGTDGSATGDASLQVTPAALDHFALIAPATVTAGIPFDLGVTAKDAFDNTLTAYTGTPSLTGSDPNPLATIPTEYTFLPGDHGTHTFVGELAFVTAGSQDVLVSDGASGTATFTVLPAALDHLVVSPNPVEIEADTTQAFTTEGRDQYDNSLGDVTADTTFAITAPGTCTGNVCGTLVIGDYTVTATDGAASGTATLHATLETMDRIVVSPDPATITAGSTQTFTAEAFDALDSMGDVTADAIFTITAPGTCTQNDCGATVAGDYTVTATDNGVTGTATLHVRAEGLDHFVVSAPATRTAGVPFDLTVTAMDIFGNTIADYAGTILVTSTDPGATLPAGYTFVPGDHGSHTFTGAVTLVTAGSQTVSATGDGETGSADVQVDAATLDHLVLTPASGTIAAGATETLAAEGRDTYDNTLGDVTGATTFTITAPGTCSGSACGANTPGDYTITGTDGSATGTATLHVTAATLDHLVLAPASATIAAGTTETLAAEGFDVFNNSRGDVTGATTFTITAPGTCSDSACGANTPGDYTITGTNGTATGTATLHVTAATLHHLVLSPASATITAGTTETLAAEGFDVFDNSRGDVTGATTFTISGSGSCSVAQCGATATGDYTITGTDGSATGTATLHVTAATLHHLVLSPASATIAAGSTETLAAEGRDVYNNSRGDVTGATTFTITAPGTCSGSACGANTLGDYTITGTDGSATGTASLHVTGAGLDHLVVTPAAGTIAAGATETLAAEGRDVHDNTLGDVTGATTFTITAPGSCSGSACGAPTPGDYTVTATNGSATGTATLYVTAAILDHLVLTPAAGTIAAGTTETLTAEGRDAYNNILGDVTGATTFTITAPGTCSGSACGATVAGNYTITGTDGSATGTATLHVTGAGLDHLVLTPAAGTIAAGATETLAAEGRDVYDNTLGDVTPGTTFAITAPGTCSGSACGATTPGDYTVTATNGSATGTATLHVTEAAPIAPQITSFTPSRARVGAFVTITGSGFSGVTAVTVDGKPATFTVVSDTQLILRVPAGASSGRIRLSSPGGVSATTSAFRVIPVITRFTPTKGKAGTRVTIIGSGFCGVTTVTFGGRKARFTVVSCTRITARVLAGMKTGRITVKSAAGTATSRTLFRVTTLSGRRQIPPVTG